MRTLTTRLLASGPFLAVCYLAAWLLLWPTEQPYWMLPFGLRFGALLLTPMRNGRGCSARSWGPAFSWRFIATR